jgi:hypothetical protein
MHVPRGKPHFHAVWGSPGLARSTYWTTSGPFFLGAVEEASEMDSIFVDVGP